MLDRIHRAHRVVLFLGSFFFALCARGEHPPCDLSSQIAQFVSIRARGGALADTTRSEHLAEELERCALSSSDSPLRETALLDAAILWYDMHRLTGGRPAATKVMYLTKEIKRRYPDSPSDAEATLLLAQVEWRLGNGADARELARQVQRLYPRTTYAQQVVLLLKTFEHPYQPSQVSVKSALPLVVLDPGHGGEDRGATGPDGVVEKEIVLSIARRVADLIRDEGRMRVALTRDADLSFPLRERTRFANEQGADLFVSLHTNASGGHQPRGLATYYLDNSDDAASRTLAERENGLLQLKGDPAHADLSILISSLIQSGKLEDSIVLAHTLQRDIIREVQTNERWRNAGIRDLGVKKAPFFVLVGAHMPCILLELLFIDNKHDAALLAQGPFREILARGIVRGISAFFEETGHKKVADYQVR